MDWLTFIAEIVKALVWPLTLAIILFLLRHSIVSLIPGLSKLRWKDLELEFKNELKEVKAEAKKVIPEAVQRETAESSVQIQELHLAHVSPRSAIITAWREVEKAASKALAKQGYERTPFPQTGGYIGRLLHEYDILDSHALLVHRRLWELRNKVLFYDQFRITRKEAEDYFLTATALARLIDSKA